MRKKLGECLIQSGLITERDLQIALAEHTRTGERVGAVLVRLNLATEKQIARALAYQLSVPYLSLSDDPPERSAVVLIPKEVALERVCVAAKLEANQLTVAMSDPLLFSLVRDLESQTGYRITPAVATRSDILESIESGYADKAIAKASGRGSDGGKTIQAPAVSHLPVRPADVPPVIVTATDDVVPKRSGDESSSDVGEARPIIDLVDLVIKSAIASRASDVHIEPMDKAVLVRHRLDGLLKEVMNLPAWVQEGLVARMKIMAGMDTTESRLPQDGRILITSDDGRDMEFRVSTLRTLHGEKIVLRGRDRQSAPPPLEELGLSAAAMDDLRRCLRQQHGLILIAGPTGSGKGTTLAAAINAIKSTRTSIITIEDPIRYQIPGVIQTQVDEKARLTFAASLCAALRQDPDVVLVGEMRDEETARIAMHAAQTGHLVLSTLHTESAPSTVTRLVDMAIEPYVIGSALIGVVAQRLVRRLCLACRRQYTPEGETLRRLAVPEPASAQYVFYKAVGCDECHNTGYRGRIALYELMRVTDKVRRLIAQRASEDVIREAAVEAGMISLGEDGVEKVKAGVTTTEELLRVVTDVREMRTCCPVCSGPVAVDFHTCPQCGHRLSHRCPKCARVLQQGWIFCPYCSSNAASKKKKRLKQQKPQDVPPSNVAEFKNQNR